MNLTKSIDFKLLSAIIFLFIFGLIMLFSASIYYADSLVDNPNFFIKKQLIYFVISLTSAFVVFKLIPMRQIERYSVVLFMLTLFLLVLVFIPIIGGEIKGAHRWIHFLGLTFQPSELLKLTIILFMSGFLIRREKEVRDGWKGLLSASIVMAFMGLLLLLETDVGAFLIIATTVFAMLFIAKAPIKLIATVILSGVALIPLIVLMIPERVARISAYLDPWSDPYGKSYQLIQSLIAIGNGQWYGVGLGAGVQKVHFLPDAHTDFIFAVIGEELGVVGMLLVLVSFSYIIYKGLMISKHALEQGKKYSSYTAYGISIWLSLQVFINISVNTGLLPTKGLTLPFFSYGGSSMLVTMIALAILLRIDGENRQIYYKNRHK